MFITRKHISRRTLLKWRGCCHRASAAGRDDSREHGAGADTAAPAKPRMGVHLLPARRRAGRSGRRSRPAPTSRCRRSSSRWRRTSSTSTVVSGLRNKGGESSDPHGIMAGTWLWCVGPKDRDGKRRSRRHRGPARRARIGQGTAIPSLEIAGEGGGSACAAGVASCGFGGTVAFRTPYAGAADGDESAQGVLRHVRPGRHAGRTLAACSMTAAACSTT